MKKSAYKYTLVAALVTGVTCAWGDPGQDGRRARDTSALQPWVIGKNSSVQPATSAKRLPSKKTLTLKGLDGATHSVEEWKGQVVLLNFWATWCAPCLYEIRDFVVYQEKYEKQGLQIVGVGLDEENKLRNVQRSLDINYPILMADPKKDRSLMVSWGNASGIVPYTVVIARDGQIVYSQHGQLSSEEFGENVLPLLSK